MQRMCRLLRFASAVGLVLLALTACDNAPVPTQKVISGTAQLSLATALPPDSRLQVILEDVSRADIAAQPLADLEQDATQPLRFGLTYNLNLIQPGMRYNLRARIIDHQGKPLWTTETQVPLPLTDTPVELKLIPIQPASVATQSVFYQCEKQNLLVKIEGDSASLFLGERVFALGQMVSASGVRYQSEEADFWSKGDEAILSVAGEPRRHCTLQPQALSLALAAQAGATLWASGNEPPWHLVRTNKDTMTLTRQYGAEVLMINGLKESATNTGAVQLDAETEVGKLVVRLEPQLCSDSMSGHEYSARVTLTLANIEFQGCGQRLNWATAPISRLPAEQ